MDRVGLLRSLVNHCGFGLEIGPSHAPIFPRAEGFNVETLDHAPADELRRKYSEMGVDVSRIEDVTYVANGAPLHETIPRRGEYDFIFSSHAIEHIPDLVGYFKSCERLLAPNGIVAMAVPDKRYTFDAAQALSTTGQALEAHYRATNLHSPAAAFDFFSNSVAMDGRSLWARTDRGPLAFASSPHQAKSAFDTVTMSEGAFIDVHGWFFTPNSFRLILHDLASLGMTSLCEIYMREMDALEFYVALAKDRPGHGLDRLQLQKNVLREQAIANMQLLAADDPVIGAAFTLLTRP